AGISVDLTGSGSNFSGNESLELLSGDPPSEADFEPESPGDCPPALGTTNARQQARTPATRKEPRNP
ncbi:MAG: hypothetical protein N2C12_04940, partial [Planctomycetales bacterium]